MKNKEALEYLQDYINEKFTIFGEDLLNKYYKVEDIDSNKTYHLVISPRSTGRKEMERIKTLESKLKNKISELQEDLEELHKEKLDLLDEIDNLKDDIDMLKGAKDHLASILDRTEYLLEYEKLKNQELESKILALMIKGEK